MTTEFETIDNRIIVTTSKVSEELGINVSVELLYNLGFTPAIEPGVGTYWFADEIAGMAVELSSCLESLAGPLEEKYGVPEYIRIEVL